MHENPFTMYGFFFGAFAAFFGILVVVQLISQKSINFSGYPDRAKDPALSWRQMLCYAAGCMGGILWIL